MIRIERSRNREPRTFPYESLPAFVELMDRQRERTSAIEQAKGIIIPHVVHRNGAPIRAFRRAWAAACVGAGLGHEVREPDVIDTDGTVHKGRLVRRVVTRTPHDFRRTAAMRPCNSLSGWWPGPESNWGHADFQSAALPTELPGQQANGH